MTNKEKIVEAFLKVKAMGWMASHRRSNTGIGKTFEDCIGVVENNRKEPDLFGFEIKAHRGVSTSYVTLFTKSPSHPRRGANAYLKEKFGEPYPDCDKKHLHTSMFATGFNTYMNRYSFRLIHKPEEERVYIGVFSVGGAELLDCSVYYTYDDLRKALRSKLHNLLYVKAQRMVDENEREMFYFDSAEIYTEPSLERFLEMLDNGEIMYDIRIGAYRSGKLAGRPHDHGGGFRVLEKHLSKLYSNREEV